MGYYHVFGEEIKEVVNACDKAGRTPLHLAAGSGSIASIEVLILLGAMVNSRLGVKFIFIR